MKNYTRTIYKILLLLIFLISTTFGCVLAMQSSQMMHNGSSTSMAACCTSNIADGAIHNIPLILVDSDILQLFLLAAFSFYLLIKNEATGRSSILKDYFKGRERYGGFKLLYYFGRLFSSGIIHPKIY